MYTNGTQDSMVFGTKNNLGKAINKTINYGKELATTLICGAYYSMLEIVNNSDCKMMSMKISIICTHQYLACVTKKKKKIFIYHKNICILSAYSKITLLRHIHVFTLSSNTVYS